MSWRASGDPSVALRVISEHLHVRPGSKSGRAQGVADVIVGRLKRSCRDGTLLRQALKPISFIFRLASGRSISRQVLCEPTEHRHLAPAVQHRIDDCDSAA